MAGRFFFTTGWVHVGRRWHGSPVHDGTEGGAVENEALISLSFMGRPASQWHGSLTFYSLVCGGTDV